MSRFVDSIRTLALALGAPGLILVAFLDSSFLPLPGITDVLLVVMVTRSPAGVVLYVARHGRRLDRRLPRPALPGTQGRGSAGHASASAAKKSSARMATLQRHGVMAVLVPSILPPPAPFKIFVLLAGVVGISPAPFATAIAIGRGARYLALGTAGGQVRRPRAGLHARARRRGLAAVVAVLWSSGLPRIWR